MITVVKLVLVCAFGTHVMETNLSWIFAVVVVFAAGLVRGFAALWCRDDHHAWTEPDL